MDRAQTRQHITQGERVLAYAKVSELMVEAFMQERRSFDLSRGAVTLRAQNVAASIVDAIIEEVRGD